MSRQPFANSPARGWKYDLPGPRNTPSRSPRPAVLKNPPNHVDDVYLELPRGTLRAKGIAYILALCCAGPALWAPVLLFELLQLESFPFQYLLAVVVVVLVMLSAGVAIYFWRMDFKCPVDEPIRFNRMRRKVYVYRFHSDGLRLFSRAAWGVKPVVYEWDDLHAEFCSTYGPMGSGGLNETVSLAILQSGTNVVLDRFLFAHGGQQGEMYWAMAQLFMQQGPHALPVFDQLPRDWNNEDHVLNIARRFAPKVVWPEAMDIESRTAP